MADLASPPSYDEKLEKHAPDSVEKVSLDSDGKIIEDDTEMVKEVEALEERIQLNEATEDEYLVQDAWEVAIKVRLSVSCSKSSHLLDPLAGLVDQG